MPPLLLVVPKLANFVTLILLFFFTQSPYPVSGKVLSGLTNLSPSDIFVFPLELASLFGFFIVLYFFIADYL